jgi:glutamyl-tRNA synthetase
VGGAKTALYNWLYARQHDGVLVLRIEDTDAERNRPEWIEGIQTALTWIGVTWDEGPVFQSASAERHVELAHKLYADGRAYWCDLTPEQIQERAKANGRSGYDGYSRDRGLGPGPGRVLRFRTPDEGSTTVHDLIRGDVVFDNSLIEDFVILRSNGTPMFLLANVIDDLDSAITHVIRAEEHLPNTPKALLLWDALGGGPPPTFAHVPLLVNEKRQKLSKRRDPVALEMYRDEGYLPEAMRNFLMLLGWAPPGGEEIVPFDTIIETFRLEDVHSSPAFFDVVKLRAINGQYIRALPVEEFIERAQPWLVAPHAPWAPEDFAPSAFAALAPLVQERVAVLSEVPAYVDFLFLPEAPVDEVAWAKAMKGDQSRAMLEATIAALDDGPWAADALKERIAAVGEGLGLKLSKAQAPVRVAVTGRAVGPPLFESLEVLGRARALGRLRSALERF